MATKTEEKTVKGTITPCSACGKKAALVTTKSTSYFSVDVEGLRKLGVEKIPASGWHWYTNKKGVRSKMYPVCNKCYEKANMKTVKAKIAKPAKK